MCANLMLQKHQFRYAFKWVSQIENDKPNVINGFKKFFSTHEGDWNLLSIKKVFILQNISISSLCVTIIKNAESQNLWRDIFDHTFQKNG